MTHNLQGLPIEVLSGIFQLLNLADIARLRQVGVSSLFRYFVITHLIFKTCRSLQALISSDREVSTIAAQFPLVCSRRLIRFTPPSSEKTEKYGLRYNMASLGQNGPLDISFAGLMSEADLPLKEVR